MVTYVIGTNKKLAVHKVFGPNCHAKLLHNTFTATTTKRRRRRRVRESKCSDDIMH